MIKISLTFLLLAFLILQGCDPDYSYSVSADENAVITQNGEIVDGPIKPGRHFKIPFIQEVHLIKVHRVWEVELHLKNSSEIKAKLLWQIIDPISFFKLIQNGATEKNIGLVLQNKLNPVLQSINKNEILEIAVAQEKDPFYSNYVTEKALNEIQQYISDSGIKARLYFSKKT